MLNGLEDVVDGIKIVQCGTAQCAPGYAYGPAIRDHYLIHFVASGRGTFHSPAESYPLSSGQGFLICPEQVTTYRADAQAPWQYGWFGYTGRLAGDLTARLGLSGDNPVFRCEDPQRLFLLIRDMEEGFLRLHAGQLWAQGIFMQIAALLSEELRPPAVADSRLYLKRAAGFMNGNYNRSLSVTDVAAFTHLSRSQLYRVFERELGCSPKQYLQKIRLSRAQKLLLETTLPQGAVAASVGLATEAQLNTLFKQNLGMTAGAFRKAGRSRNR